MDGYTKAAIRKAIAKRSARQIKFDEFMERLINGPAVYGIALLFYWDCAFVLWFLGLRDLGIYLGLKSNLVTSSM